MTTNPGVGRVGLHEFGNALGVPSHQCQRVLGLTVLDTATSAYRILAISIHIEKLNPDMISIHITTGLPLEGPLRARPPKPETS
ncbi:hypothetical protein NLI96_g4540 [Meripilus lineatus]|uniref:Uncharacterized protein n=1 Tax=Meripilus lineatus TaxID=2056292 RepID=A0AAD5YEN9_9APHY|nr:hypothetical protein NLI96_g4540 [Physisporinus lineatus]